MNVLVEFWPKFALCYTEVPSFVSAGGALSQSHTPPFQACIYLIDYDSRIWGYRPCDSILQHNPHSYYKR